jgi:hypothetical protein
MKFQVISLLQKNRMIRIAALIYGLIFFNMGAVILFEKLSARPVVIDEGFKGALLFVFLGLLALYAVVRARHTPPDDPGKPPRPSSGPR